MDINWAIVAPLLIVDAILIIIALFDLSRVEKTNGPKWIWVLVSIFISILGPVLYFIFGRRQ
jgi:hypothetical protein